MPIRVAEREFGARGAEAVRHVICGSTDAMIRVNRALLSGCLAVTLTAMLSGCGTLFNLAGFQPPAPARMGPNKGKTVTIPQAAFFGGSRLDVAMVSVSVGTKEVETSLFGRYTTFDCNPNDAWLYFMLLLDVPLSFCADVLLLPLTALVTDPDPSKWPEPCRKSKKSRAK